MGKTLKDKVNHFKHHLDTDPELSGHFVPSMPEGKRRYKADEIPADVKDKLDTIESSRYGDQRKMRAKMKVDARKKERRRNNSLPDDNE